MATYPEFTQITGTEVKGLDGTSVQQVISGRYRIRRYFSETQFTVSIAHYLNQTEVNELLTFYNVNRSLPFTFMYQFDGNPYPCYFAGHPTIKPDRGGYANVSVVAVGAI